MRYLYRAPLYVQLKQLNVLLIFITPLIIY